MSSIHGNGTQVMKRGGDNNDITKLNITVEDNKYMNGVDKCNQYLNYYSLERKAKKWWKKVFYRMLELCSINALVLYFVAHPYLAKKRQEHKLFRIQLVHDLAQPLLDSQASVENEVHSPIPGRTSVSHTRLQGKHFAESRPPVTVTLILKVVHQLWRLRVLKLFGSDRYQHTTCDTGG